MAALFASGRIIWLVLCLVAVEAAAVVAVSRWRGGGVPVGFLANLASGAALMLALRSALVGERWEFTALWMLGGLVAHGVDAGLRWRGQA